MMAGINVSRGAATVLIFILAVAGGLGLAGCGSSTSTSGGGSSGTVSDAVLVAQQVDAFKTALAAMDGTALAQLISSAYSESAPGGTTKLTSDEFLAWLKNGVPLTVFKGFQAIFKTAKINTVSASLGSASVSGSTATVEGTLTLGTGSTEATDAVGGRALTDLNITYHFPTLSLRFVKDSVSGKWLLVGFSAPVLAIAGSQFGPDPNPPQGQQATQFFEFQVTAYKTDALVTDVTTANKPTVTSSNTSIASTNQAFMPQSAPGLGDLWTLVVPKTQVTSDVDVSISGLKGTTASGGATFAFTHKVDVGQTK